MERTILHCDLNNFFASVACLENPDIRDKAVAVCGSVEDRHGIVLAKNELAKSFGILTAETVWQAKLKCPNLVIVPPNFKSYNKFSEQARKIYSGFTEKIEPFGIDECWLDITGSHLVFGSNEEIADTIRSTIKSKLGLTISVGVSFNKVFAKLGSDLKKPDAVSVITRDNFRDVIWPLKVEAMLGIGPATKKALWRLGIFTISDIANTKPEVLQMSLGKSGAILHKFANGDDSSQVAENDQIAIPKSIGRSTTCKQDLCTNHDVHGVFLRLCDDICRKLRNYKLEAGTVAISLRTNTLEIKQFQITLPHPTIICSELCEFAYKLFLKQYFWKQPLRSVGVRVTDLQNYGSGMQLELFGNNSKHCQLEILEKSIDIIRNKFGKDSLVRAVTMGITTSDPSGKESDESPFKNTGSVLRQV